MNSRAGAPAALALDLGTTRVKLGLAGEDGALLEVRAAAAPRPEGDGLVRRLDADRYRRAAEELLAEAPSGLPLGVASQRSSFLLWDREGRPATPLISWQDRSAEAWCARAEDGAELARRTGLVLSPHYAGPKLAALFEGRPGLARRAAEGELLFGTLESWLVWQWSGGVHETDLSMAARTMLVALGERDWSPSLVTRFGVPPAALGRVVASSGRRTELCGAAGERLLTASLADQPAAVVASLGTAPGGALVNLGTGVFCLVPTGSRPRREEGYLAGPLLAQPATGEEAAPGEARFGLEGTVNGGGATADRQAPGPTAFPPGDPTPAAFCVPDENGVGAPWWRAAQPFALETGPGARPDTLAPADRRRLVLEGLVFRAAAILADLDGRGGDGGERVLVSGGLAAEPFVPAALASVLGREVQVLEEEESTLLGAARLALGLATDSAPAPRVRTVAPADHGRWLADKSLRWRAWLAELLASGS